MLLEFIIMLFGMKFTFFVFIIIVCILKINCEQPSTNGTSMYHQFFENTIDCHTIFILITTIINFQGTKKSRVPLPVRFSPEFVHFSLFFIKNHLMGIYK